nr:hypothetical protein [Mycolicibacter arupensis]
MYAGPGSAPLLAARRAGRRWRPSWTTRRRRSPR